MIIITRALSQRRKKEGKAKGKKRPKKRGKKEKRDNCYYLFPHLCFKVAQCSSLQRVSCLVNFIYQWEFSLQNLACIFQRWDSSNALGLREQASWMHTHQFLLLSFHSFLDLVHLLHGNPYSLTLISIDGHLHSPMIRLVDVRLSPSFLSSPQPPLFHPQCYIHGSCSCIV